MTMDQNIKKEITRFLFAGVIVIAIDFSVYFSLLHFLSSGLSKGISFTCAGVAGYVINKYWTFKCDQPSYSEAGRFALVNFLALGLNVSVNQSILGLWREAVYLALAIATVLTNLFIFICFKWWVYKSSGIKE